MHRGNRPMGGARSQDRRERGDHQQEDESAVQDEAT
jgi:hypothetical protein